MADEELAAQEGLATPATPNETQDDTPELDTEDEALSSEEESEDGQSDEDDEIEFEADDGTKYRIPKSLESALLRNRDYTQKTQSLAETRRALEQQQAEIEQRFKATDEELDTRADLKRVSLELDRFKDFTFEAYQQFHDQDPLAAEKAWNYAQHLRTQKAELEGKLGQFSESRTQALQAEYGKRAEETRRFAETQIKGWNPELDAKLQEFAAAEGITPDFIRSNLNPTTYKLIWKAFLGEQALKRQSAPKTPAPPPPPVKTVKSRATPSPTALSDDLPVEEWVKRREARLTRNGRG